MLQTESLSYQLHGKPLLQAISLKFLPGKFYALIGDNGAGKSTFLKVLAGIWKPTSGKVLWQGKDLLAQERRTISSTISLVPPNAQIYFEFSVRELVSMGRYALETSEGDEEKLKLVLERVDAWHLRDRAVSQLSSGERQRVYIARSLMSEAPILLLDEPTASLDLRHQHTIWELLESLRQDGRLVIVASHDIHAIQVRCDQVILLEQGKII